MNVTDALVDNVIKTIKENHAEYFDSMAKGSFTLKRLKQVKKGSPNPLKWYTPSAFVIPEKTVMDGPLHIITITILYLLKGQDSEILARSIARGADALAQLIDKWFSPTVLEYEFEYGLGESSAEAAAQITAELVI